jgi:hypothetical protein
MQQVRLARDVTSFELEIETLTEESLHERYVRLKRELDQELDASSDDVAVAAPPPADAAAK